MKKFLAIISLALVIATLACLLSSCGAGKLKGKWKNEETGLTYEFKSGGKGKMSMSFYGSTYEEAFTYKVKGNKLEMKATDDDGETNTETVTFKVSGKTLTMTAEGKTIEFKKVK